MVVRPCIVVSNPLSFNVDCGALELQLDLVYLLLECADVVVHCSFGFVDTDNYGDTAEMDQVKTQTEQPGLFIQAVNFRKVAARVSGIIK